MAKANSLVSDSYKKKSLKHIGAGIHMVSGRTRWAISKRSPKKVEDLSFVGREADGTFTWWSVTPPKTEYWSVHKELGRAYAFELLDLMNTPDSDYPESILSFISTAMFRWRIKLLSNGQATGGDGVMYGFYEALGEYLSTGTANR